MLFFISTWGPYRNCDEATTGIYWLEDAINNIVRKGNYKGAEIVEVVSMLYFAQQQPSRQYPIEKDDW